MWHVEKTNENIGIMEVHGTGQKTQIFSRNKALLFSIQYKVYNIKMV